MSSSHTAPFITPNDLLKGIHSRRSNSIINHIVIDILLQLPVSLFILKGFFSFLSFLDPLSVNNEIFMDNPLGTDASQVALMHVMADMNIHAQYEIEWAIFHFITRCRCHFRRLRKVIKFLGIFLLSNGVYFFYFHPCPIVGYAYLKMLPEDSYFKKIGSIMKKISKSREFILHTILCYHAFLIVELLMSKESFPPPPVENI